nr:hypothetical protein [Tanacetum cinerariifolium]GFB41680.1 hypothetical protein [Tanacetum cinerariifolium]
MGSGLVSEGGREAGKTGRGGCGAKVEAVGYAADEDNGVVMMASVRPLPWGLRGGGCCHGEGMVVRGVAADYGWGQGRSGDDEWWGLWMVGRRVGASHIVDRIDRVIRVLFGFGGKSSPENFSGGGRRWRRWWPPAGGGRPVGDEDG